MRNLIYGVLVITLCQFGVFAEDRIASEETPEEKEKREFKEFKEFKERQKKESEENEKKIYIYFQGSRGNSETEFERGKISSPKLGFEYRLNPMFGIGLGLSNNILKLESKDTSSGPLLGYLLLTAPITNRTAGISDERIMANRTILAALLSAPIAYNYRYTSMHLDFNFHFNRAKFFDPYLGIGFIAGTCGISYPCTVTGGELKAGTQFNFETFFTYFQVQGQMIRIKEPGIGTFPTQNLIGSLGIGVRF
jgi:hypothetical protein